MQQAKRQTFGGYESFPLCKAVRAAGLIFCSGQVPMTAAGAALGGEIEDQTRYVLDQLRATLESTGAEWADVVKVNIILADPKDFPAFNRVYRDYFPTDPPARTTICATLLLDVLVEIELIAAA